MAELDLEARLDELFASEPQAFVGARDALARELGSEGHRDEAAAVKALRRPTVAVAAVNRIARTHGDQLQALVAIGAELAALQAEREPDRDELRDLTRERRTLLRQLTEAAAGTTARPDGARSSIAATLDTASLDEQLRDDLVRGRLTHELTPAARFVPVGDAPAPRASRRSIASRSLAKPRDELAARRTRAALDAAQERFEEAEEALHEHAVAAVDATERLEAAHRHIAELEAALADARAELVDLKRAEREAHRAEQRARTEHERVSSALRAAERAVDGSE